MFLYVCHLFPPERLLLPEIKQRLYNAGFVSVTDELATAFRNRVGFLGLEIAPPLAIPEDSEILAANEGQGLCHITVGMAEKEKPFVDIHIIAPDADTGSRLADLCHCFADLGNARQGTLREVQLIETLTNRLTDSPNGKMLKDESITAVLAELYDPEMRNSIRSVVQMFGQDAAPQKAIIDRFGQVMAGKKASTLFKKLLGEEKSFDRRYVLACSSCGTPMIEFVSQEAAAHSLETTSSRKCKICDEGDIRVIEAYSIKEAVYKGLQQGLWLEKLVYDLVRPLCIFAVVGQMVDTFEMDVVGVGYGRTILLECKDTSFGQNDFINLNAKADEIEAEVIGIITTQPLHDNVNRFIERTKQQTRRTIFIVHDSEDAATISSRVQEEMTNIRNEYLRQLLSATELGIVSPWARMARRVLPRWTHR